MADISKCKDDLCPSRNSCYRYLVAPKEFNQSYTNFHREEDESNCNNYIKSTCSKKGIKREGESCNMNNNCTFPICMK
jgi:hypothetical protein